VTGTNVALDEVWPRRGGPLPVGFSDAGRNGCGTVDGRDAGQDDRAVVVREAVIANRDTINATLRAGAGRIWCCLAALAVYPAPCPFGHLPGRRQTSLRRPDEDR